jgi:hypothetical protein
MTTRFKPGDYVLVRCKVLEAIDDQEIGYAVEVFSKTDQYKMWVRPDLIIDKVPTPIPPEPDRKSLVRDNDGDTWEWSGDGLWICGDMKRPWEDLFRYGAPITVYEESETHEP